MRKNIYKTPTRYELLVRLGHMPAKSDKSLKKPATREDLLKALKHSAEEIEMLVELGDDLTSLPDVWEGEDGAENLDTSTISTLSFMLRAYEDIVSDLDHIERAQAA